MRPAIRYTGEDTVTPTISEARRYACLAGVFSERIPHD